MQREPEYLLVNKTKHEDEQESQTVNFLLQTLVGRTGFTPGGGTNKLIIKKKAKGLLCWDDPADTKTSADN